MDDTSGRRDHEDQLSHTEVFHLTPYSTLNAGEDHQELSGPMKNESTPKSEPINEQRSGSNGASTPLTDPQAPSRNLVTNSCNLVLQLSGTVK